MRKMLAVVIVVTGLAAFFLRFVPMDTEVRAAETAPKVRFGECWGYLMRGEEALYTGREGFTDVAYFSAAIDETGGLSGPTEPPKLPGPAVRHHLVISAPWNRALAHFCLRPDLPIRDTLVTQIVKTSANFDGVQIDIEAILPDDRDNFMAFLAAVRAALPAGRTLSVAVLARWQKNPRDPFDYATIGRIADKVVVMAYDEHHRTGAAGPVASLAWCKKIVEHAVVEIPARKLVMGLPLYGRAWQTETHAKAFRFHETVALLSRLGKNPERSPDGGPHVVWNETVEMKLFFEDVASLHGKLRLYEGKKVASVAFWRVGQGPEGIWRLVQTR